MRIATVQGAHHETISLKYDSDMNANLARQIAGAIQSGLKDGTIFAADNADGRPPVPPPGGATGELVVSISGTTLLPPGYDYVVDSAKRAVIFGNGDANEQVLAGKGNLSFFATGGSGSVIAGGGDDLVSVAPTDAGNWLIALGNGDDSVRALGGGNDTISLGSGHSIIQLGSGSTFVTTTGSDTVMAGSGSETIDASGSCGTEVILCGAWIRAGFPATVHR